MSAIFPVAPLAFLLGFIRKREKEARRAAEAQRQASSWPAAIQPARAVATMPKPAMSGGRGP
jgi:hypothetical protein